MASSGSRDFELDVAEYVEEAFERCGLEVRTGYDLQSARRSLNILFADWANRGLNRWTMTQESITLASGIAEYPLGTLTMTVAASGNFSVGETITGGTSSATASITSKPSATSMAITIPSGTFSSGETLTGGTSSATTTLSSAVSFEDVQSSIDVLSAVIRQNSGTSNQADTSISRISRDTFINISNKRSTSTPSQYYVDRQITPKIKLWPTPNSSALLLVFDRMRRIEDVDTMTNTADVPFRFYPCLTAGLAYYLCLKKNTQKLPILKQQYEQDLLYAIKYDEDRSPLKIDPKRQYI